MEESSRNLLGKVSFDNDQPPNVAEIQQDVSRETIVLQRYYYQVQL